MSDPLSSRDILNRLRELAPKDDQRLHTYLDALEDSLNGEEEAKLRTAQMLAEYEEAYQKLTAPANRIGVFIKWLEDKNALVALGDGEYVAQVDPSVAEESLVPGSRIKLNEAYAVLGSLEASAGGPLFRVAEVMEDRLRLGAEEPGRESRLVGRGASLADSAIKPGDEVRLDPAGRFAIEHFPRREAREYFFEEVPDLAWEAVGGQDEAIKLIRETIELPLIHPEIFERYEKKPVKGILLYGPPGCGKTLIGKAAAANLTKAYSERVGHPVKEVFLSISGPKILNMWLGETERMVREIFSIAREKAKDGNLVFIFMDEAESLLRTRSSGRWLNISNTVVPQFCAELDGLVSLENVVLILTSNRPDYIDPAVLRPERIDRKVKVRRPDREASQSILGIYLKASLPLDPELLAKYGGESDCARKELVEGAIAHLWRTDKETEFLKVQYRNGRSETLYWKDLVSGALLKSVVDRAKDSAIRRAIESPDQPHGITLEDLTEGLAAEYRENEIFPKSDVQDDWLKLLDVEPDNVAQVRPVGPSRGEEWVRRTVI